MSIGPYSAVQNKISATLTNAEDLSDVIGGGELLENRGGGNRAVTIHLSPSASDATYEVHFQASPDGKLNWEQAEAYTNSDDKMDFVGISPQLFYRFRLVSLSAGTIKVTATD